MKEQFVWGIISKSSGKLLSKLWKTSGPLRNSNWCKTQRGAKRESFDNDIQVVKYKIVEVEMHPIGSFADKQKFEKYKKIEEILK